MTNKKAEAEADILTVLRGWKYHYGPTFREVADHLSLPVGTVHALCRSLRDQGKIVFEDHVARSLKIAPHKRVTPV